MVAYLASKRLTLALLVGLVFLLVPESLGLLSPVYLWPSRLLLVALSINLMVCTATQWHRLPSSVLMVHIGILLILAGGLWGKLGFTATVNIHEGASSATAFRWDRQEDTSLGFSLMVNRINREYYPTPIRIGVLVDGNPVQLCEVATGERIICAGLQIKALAFDPTLPALTLAVTSSAGVRSEIRVTGRDDSESSGTVFQLVAFKTPVIKRTWVDLTIITDGGPLVTGQSEVNHPFTWQGYRLFHTAIGTDPSGLSYAGIQIVKDQGIPLVYLGFAVLCVGNFLVLRKKL